MGLPSPSLQTTYIRTRSSSAARTHAYLSRPSFDQVPGNLFVVRVAGNFVNVDNFSPSIEFAVDSLKATLVVVLGHSKCGALSAALAFVRDGIIQRGHIPEIVSAVVPSVQSADGSPGDWLENAIATTMSPATSRWGNSRTLRSYLKRRRLGKSTGDRWYLRRYNGLGRFRMTTPREESRLPPAVSVAALVVILVAVPRHYRLLPPFSEVVIGGALIAFLWTPFARYAISVFAVIVGSVEIAILARLLYEMAAHPSNLEAIVLLWTAIDLWLTNIVLFTLIYWQLIVAVPLTRQGLGGASRFPLSARRSQRRRRQ